MTGFKPYFKCGFTSCTQSPPTTREFWWKWTGHWSISRCLDLFLWRLIVNLVPCMITLPGATTSTKYTTYADDVPRRVTNNAKINLQLVKKCLKVLEGVKIAGLVCGFCGLILNRMTDMCAMYIYPLIIYHLSVLPLSCSDSYEVIELLLCVVRPATSIPPWEALECWMLRHQNTLHLQFFGQMCKDDENSSF